MRGESTAEVVVIEGEGEGCSTARRMSKAPDEKERLKAAELLGKRFGLFTDKINVDGGTKVVIVDDLDE
jgi:phage terminase small subunit